MTDCLFCKIANREITTRFEYEDNELFVLKDIAPQAPVHLLIIPKIHIPSLADVMPKHEALLGKLATVASRLAQANGLNIGGYRMVNNCGKDGGQAVAHLHFHLLGGRKFTWPPG